MPGTGNSEALVRALGEFAMFLRKRRGKSQSSEKSSISRWLRSLSVEELASLCCVQDAGFVKTLLQMAARSRGSRGVSRHVQEFQLLSVGVGGSIISQSKRQAAKTPSKTSLREFVKRPLVQTEDGDIVGAFYPREYEECSGVVLRGMRVLNTLQSCDTVALSMDFFEMKEGKKAAEFFHMMEVISHGDFLSVCPTEATLKHRVWGETKSKDTIRFKLCSQTKLSVFVATFRGLAVESLG
ncbi:hypothetical protein BBO99_00003853 [Phytophthora kernoviae]|uniref:Uncharacterized protein n=2 Tax=Phytophthora kernoviae TaxID=325452 RepID=A0A3R7NHU7_9STRA|nr:hypothetical protein G195_004416 [Phytophthora kernoviae 00238/432]KAG2526657.1 hypothetical protein JM16_003594 [Phytophthora kernoviae]KAG2528348.1 hypothetical protein JM18_003300 [Phytophthora kernoviae]RLN37377.1 hypothetical protein BBI17_003982 [Phytophthora kernoviae]RLN81255.1 hypothetical protein BBO99_00003853 [Phytophthora kernoviae]